MGTLAAIELRSKLALVEGLRIHLRLNHYPPIPLIFVEVAQKAIERFHEGAEFVEVIELPERAIWKGKKQMTIGEVIEAMHLKPWIGS